MLTSILQNNSWQNNSGIAHILSRIDFKKFNDRLSHAKTWHKNDGFTVVLFEYTHSGINDTVAEMERLPGTTKFIHDFLNDNEVAGILKSLFVSKPNMKLFSRRKFGLNGELTKYRQYVLHISPEVPSVVLNPEDSDDEDYSDMPPLIPVWAL